MFSLFESNLYVNFIILLINSSSGFQKNQLVWKIQCHHQIRKGSHKNFRKTSQYGRFFLSFRCFGFEEFYFRKTSQYGRVCFLEHKLPNGKIISEKLVSMEAANPYLSIFLIIYINFRKTSQYGSRFKLTVYIQSYNPFQKNQLVWKFVSKPNRCR